MYVTDRSSNIPNMFWKNICEQKKTRVVDPDPDPGGQK
jgi:hypothetical protein